MKPPKHIIIGPHTYRLTLTLLGKTDHQTCRIVVDGRQAPSQVADTVVHELLHACMDVIGAGDDLGHDTEERVVRRLAPVLLDVLARNPGLVSWLTR